MSPTSRILQLPRNIQTGREGDNKILQMCTDSLTRCRIGAFGLQDERRIRANKRKSFSIQDSTVDHPIGPLIKLDVT